MPIRSSMLFFSGVTAAVASVFGVGVVSAQLNVAERVLENGMLIRASEAPDAHRAAVHVALDAGVLHETDATSGAAFGLASWWKLAPVEGADELVGWVGVDRAGLTASASPEEATQVAAALARRVGMPHEPTAVALAEAVALNPASMRGATLAAWIDDLARELTPDAPLLCRIDSASIPPDADVVRVFAHMWASPGRTTVAVASPGDPSVIVESLAASLTDLPARATPNDPVVVVPWGREGSIVVERPGLPFDVIHRAWLVPEPEEPSARYKVLQGLTAELVREVLAREEQVVTRPQVSVVEHPPFGTAIVASLVVPAGEGRGANLRAATELRLAVQEPRDGAWVREARRSLLVDHAAQADRMSGLAPQVQAVRLASAKPLPGESLREIATAPEVTGLELSGYAGVVLRSGTQAVFTSAAARPVDIARVRTLRADPASGMMSATLGDGRTIEVAHRTEVMARHLPAPEVAVEAVPVGAARSVFAEQGSETVRTTFIADALRGHPVGEAAVQTVRVEVGVQLGRVEGDSVPLIDRLAELIEAAIAEPTRR
ncbi:MAG: hypothetical protein AAGI30_00690 [Planctomycetota bacterium]